MHDEEIMTHHVSQCSCIVQKVAIKDPIQKELPNFNKEETCSDKAQTLAWLLFSLCALTLCLVSQLPLEHCVYFSVSIELCCVKPAVVLHTQ